MTVLLKKPPGWQPGAVRRLILLPILAIACLAGACGGPAAGGLAGKSASEVIALAQAAAAERGFVPLRRPDRDGEERAASRR